MSPNYLQHPPIKSEPNASEDSATPVKIDDLIQRSRKSSETSHINKKERKAINDNLTFVNPSDNNMHNNSSTTEYTKQAKEERRTNTLL